MNQNRDMKRLLAQAYKKLKSSVYFDKTQLILRNQLVEFESETDLDSLFTEMALQIKDENEFDKLTEEILDSINVFSFPKTLAEDERNNGGIIFNASSARLEVEDLQFSIDMDIRGHILGMLWLMLVGYKIDQNIYEHSYGNRIRKSLYNELSKKPTYSPYLFKPYFEQYESWRDTAMDEASRHLKSGQDVVIVTMDFKRYYYSIDMDRNAFETLFADAFVGEDVPEEKYPIEWCLNKFVGDVVSRYAQLFEEDMYDSRCILPIGFLPSNVIGNWYLKNFDKAVVDGWNPIYFGRYVDDVIIVDKVEQNSDIYLWAKEDILEASDIIEYFLLQCSRWTGAAINGLCAYSKENALLQIDDKETQLLQNEKEGPVYRINAKYNAVPGSNSKIIVQNKKVKIFYFKSGETDALIRCFREQISKNKSEFRRMPEDESYFQHDDYTEIYHLNSSDSPNKLRAVDGLCVDKYELSKYLGKHLRIGGMIEDARESKFERDIQKIFHRRVIIENYISWEKVIEIFVINERFETVQKFIEKVISAIDELYCGDRTSAVKGTLYQYLHSAICRTFALVWKQECRNALDGIYENLEEKLYMYTEMFFSYEDGLKEERKNYCFTRMIDKAVMPIVFDMLNASNIFQEDADLNLTKFYDVLGITRKKWPGKYIFHPYLITMYDFSMITAIEEFHVRKKELPFGNLNSLMQNQMENYILSNYDVEDRAQSNQMSLKATEISISDRNAYLVEVGNKKKEKLSIAIANVKLDHENFESVIRETPNRSLQRYKDLSRVVNAAIDNKVDILIMPEAYVPFEWLSTLARTCAKNKLAVVTGVEHVKFSDRIYNLTAVILPYEETDHWCAHLTFHLKTHYAPNEKQEIRGYRLKEVEGETYELYKWNGCYFPVYCCYELASIYDRALFQSYADFIVAIEWNKDVNYYSNILESLSRDIHCYCIQVNSSDYGDSRITKPTRTEEKDIIRTKGGKNSTILVETIDVEKLREFQLKEYELQALNPQFKPTPPDFNADIVMRKIRGEKIV